MRLYHLTPSHFALSAIALRRLKISRFSELNDPFELLAVNLECKEHRKAFREVKDELNKSKGMLSFSRYSAHRVRNLAGNLETGECIHMTTFPDVQRKSIPGNASRKPVERPISHRAFQRGTTAPWAGEILACA